MWQDMVLYWAWRGDEPKEGLPPTPTHKRIEYAEIIGPNRYLNGYVKGELIHMSLAVTVFDDDTPKQVYRDQLEWHRQQGSEILMPSNA